MQRGAEERRWAHLASSQFNARREGAAGVLALGGVEATGWRGAETLACQSVSGTASRGVHSVSVESCLWLIQ